MDFVVELSRMSVGWSAEAKKNIEKITIETRVSSAGDFVQAGKSCQCKYVHKDEHEKERTIGKREDSA